MSRVLGILLILLAVWVGLEVMNEGVDGAFGGAFARFVDDEEVQETVSTTRRAANAFQRAYNRSEERVDEALARTAVPDDPNEALDEDDDADVDEVGTDVDEVGTDVDEVDTDVDEVDGDVDEEVDESGSEGGRIDAGAAALLNVVGLRRDSEPEEPGLVVDEEVDAAVEEVESRFDAGAEDDEDVDANDADEVGGIDSEPEEPVGHDELEEEAAASQR